MTVNTPPAAGGQTLTNGLVGTAYSQSVAGSGTGPLSYSVTSGALPAGLTLNSSTGLISGTPTATTSNPAPSFGVTVSSPYGTATGTYSILVQQAPTLTGSTPPDGLVGVGYSYTPSVTGTGPITYA